MWIKGVRTCIGFLVVSASSFYMKSMTYGSIQAVNFTTFALTLAEINLLSELAHQEDRYHPSRTTRTIYDPRLLDKLVKLTLKHASGYVMAVTR